MLRAERAILPVHRRITGLPLVALLPLCAHAGHPMLTEDTGTQGTGNYEVELGEDWSRQSGAHDFLFQPQLSYGATPTLDLIVQPSWLRERNASGAVAQGLGDTNLDVKWRFYGAAPLSLGIRAGAEVATQQHELGLPHGRTAEHLIAVASIDATPWSVDLNAGYAHMPAGPQARADLYHFSAATQYVLNEHLIAILESSADGNPDPTHPGCVCVALAGVIYSVHPGLDLDAGYRGRLSSPAPAQQWLLGITWRGAW